MTSNSEYLDTAHMLGHMAARSLEGEARLTPKPGLVDSANTGAHKDMNLDTFLTSAQALEPYFIEYAAAGLGLSSDDPKQLATQMRRIGIGAEQAMFEATLGINTHKGANFTFALVLGATGALISNGIKMPFSAQDSARLLNLVSLMGTELLNHDTQELLARTKDGASNTLSNGECIYLAQGLKGIRGEAAQGYPVLANVLLPYLRSHATLLNDTKEGARIVLLRVLIKLMANLEDTNVVHRGGMEALTDHLSYCQELDRTELSDAEIIAVLDTYNTDLVAKNVSPGGAADLLSLGIFFAQLEGLISSIDHLVGHLS